MIAPLPRLTYELTDDMEEMLSIRGRRQVFRDVNYAMADEWQQRFKHLHFQSGASSRYSYQKRARATLRRKQQLASRGVVQDGGQTDLVHTGATREAAMRWHPIKATPKFSTVRLHLPRYININYKPGRPKLAAEILAVNENETRAIGAAGQKAGDKSLRENKRVRRKSIR